DVNGAAEVSAQLAGGGNQGLVLRRLGIAPALVADEEESLVVPDGPAEGCAVLVLVEWSRIHRRIETCSRIQAHVFEAVPGVENVVPQNLPAAPMPGVASRLGNHVDDTAENSSVFGLVVVTLDFELLDGIYDRQYAIHRAAQVGVDDAIKEIQG